MGTLASRVTVDEPIDEFDLDVHISVLPDEASAAADTHWQSCLGTCGNLTCFCR